MPPKQLLQEIKLLPEIKIPLVNVSFPPITLPDLTKPLKLDERQMEVLRFAAMDDLADIIPFAGDIGSDLAYAELKKQMTPDEYERFIENNKILPSSLAVLKTFAETGRFKSHKP